MFFRYPGGKSKLRNQIVKKLNEIANNEELEYREAFFGGGSIGTLMLGNPNIKTIWINDFDLGIASLWTTVIRNPSLLKEHVLNFKPSVEIFDQYKKELTSAPPKLISDIEIAEYGFKKLAIHQISYSGLGTKSGGPLGGRDQKSNYKIDCRWSPHYICKKIDTLNQTFSKFSFRNNECTNLDFSELINDDSKKAILYLDPPYYVKGNDLYQHGFTQEDHIRLADCLKKTKHRWVLSYDDCREIRNLYSWADIQVIDGVSYTITATKDKETGERKSRSKPELLISSRKTEMHPIHIQEPRIITQYFRDKEVECFSVDVTDEEYDLCEHHSHKFWSNDKPGAYGKGLANTESDSAKVTRIGLLGQMAFAKIFNQPMDFEYREKGDKYDNKIGSWTYDIKCAMRNYGRGLIYHTNEWGTKLPLDKNIYVFSFLQSENKEEKRATIIFVGFALQEDVLLCKVQKGIRGNGHLNYVVNFHEVKPIKNLLELKKRTYGP